MLIGALLSISYRYCFPFFLPNTDCRVPDTFEIRLSFRSALVLVFRPASFSDIPYIRFPVPVVVRF